VTLPPLDRSTIWPYEDGQPGRFYYQRNGNPVVAAAEEALGALDGGHAVLFPSGTGAAVGLVLSTLEPGSTVALADGAYYGTGVAFATLGRWGLRHVEYDQTRPPPAGADLVWTEAPSNPLLTLPDLEAAAAHPAPLLVDSTAATPVHLRPLEHGADYALHSATKFLGGHHDVLLGVVVCRRAEDAERIGAFRNSTGNVPAPDPAWLLLRSLETLELRVRRQTASAMELARRLAADPNVERVRYPGFGALISFDVAGGHEAAVRVETGTARIVNATSLGGTTTTLETRTRWEGDRIPANLVRLSVGLEDVDRLWDDLEQALARA
jgi:cystathionine gamma-synthase